MLAGQRFATSDAHAYRQALLLGRQPLCQLAAVARREAENGHALLADQRADFLGIPLALGAQHQPRTGQQWHQQALGGGVEVDRIEMQLAVVRAHVEALDHRLAVHGDFAMADHHAFRQAGGAGGVDQVRLMLRQADERRLAVRVAGQFRQVLFQAPARHAFGQLAQGVEQGGVAEQQAHAAVFDHVLQAFQRVFRVQRHVGAAGLEDRQQADDHFQRTLQCQANPHLRADATLAQHPGQAVDLGIQLAVAQGLATEGQRAGLGVGAHALAEQAVNALVEALLARLGAEAVEQALAFAVIQQRQLAEALLRVIQQRLQQVAPVPGHARDARLIEEVGAVGQAATQAVIQLGDFQVEVELGRPGVVDQVFHGHARQLAALLEFPALHVAHHLEQRVPGGAARRLQGFHQMVEWQVLVRLAFDHGVANLFEQLADAHLPVELHAQHLGVEEGADQPFAFRADTVGHRRADAQVGLAAVAVEQHRQGGGHGHEQGQAILRVEGAHAAGQVIGEVEAEQLALVALHRGTRTVAGQFQQRMFLAQLRGPVVQLALALAGFQPLALPHAVVEVLYRQWFQRRRLAVEEGFVEQAQLAGKDVHRPAFGDDVVQGQDEVVLLLAGLDQAGAQQRAGLQVERRVRFAVGESVQAHLAFSGRQRREIQPLHGDAGLFRDLLAGHAVDAREGGAQGFVAQDQRLQRGLEAADIERAAQARHAADVVRRAVRLHLPEEPHALLRIGQRHRLATIDLADRLLAVALAGGMQRRDTGGEIAQLAVLEQHPQRQLDVAALPHAGNDLGRQQRVAAEFEEVIGKTDARHAQHVAPDRGDALFQLGLRLDVLAGLPLRFRQGAAVEFAARAEGHDVEAHQLRRHHVFRQFQRQLGLEPRHLRGLALLARLGGEVAHQLRAGDGLADQHRGLANARQRQQAGFDFLRFDAETTQLHLMVETAEILQRAIGGPAHTVAGAVKTSARLAGSVRHEALGGQPGATQIATSQTDAADAQLTGHAIRLGIQLAIQHAADHVAQRAANRRTRAIVGLAVPVGDVDRSFGRAVAVVQLRVGQLRQHAVAQLGGQRLATGEHPAQAVAASGQRLVDEQLQQRRHEVQRGHAVLAHQLRDAVRIAVLAGAGDDQFATGDQRPEAFPHRHVKADRRLLHQHVGFVQLIRGLHPLQALGQGRVRIAHPFRLAGGAGGVNHVGEVVAVHMQARRVARPVVQLEGVQGDSADALGARQVAEQVALGQQQRHAAVGQHVGQALARVIRVQRHIGATGLDDRQQADQQLRRALHGDRHFHIRTDALVAQVVGQAVGLDVQTGKVEAAAIPH